MWMTNNLKILLLFSFFSSIESNKFCPFEPIAAEYEDYGWPIRVPSEIYCGITAWKHPYCHGYKFKPPDVCQLVRLNQTSQPNVEKKSSKRNKKLKLPEMLWKKTDACQSMITSTFEMTNTRTPMKTCFGKQEIPTRILMTGGTKYEMILVDDVEVITIPSPCNSITEDGKVFEIDPLPFPLFEHGLFQDKLIGGTIDFNNHMSKKVFQLTLKKTSVKDKNRIVIRGHWIPIAELIERRSHFDAVVDPSQNMIEVMGGKSGGVEISWLNTSETLIKGTWQKGRDLPKGMQGYTVTRVQNKGIDVLIGSDDNSDMEIWTTEYDQKMPKWQLKWTDVGNDCFRNPHSAIVTKNSIYMVGGQSSAETTCIVNLDTFEVKTGPSLPVAFLYRGCVITNGYGQIFITGGNERDGRIMEFKDESFVTVDGVTLKMNRSSAACIDLDTLEIN